MDFLVQKASSFLGRADWHNLKRTDEVSLYLYRSLQLISWFHVHCLHWPLDRRSYFISGHIEAGRGRWCSANQMLCVFRCSMAAAGCQALALVWCLDSLEEEYLTGLETSQTSPVCLMPWGSSDKGISCDVASIERNASPLLFLGIWYFWIKQPAPRSCRNTTSQ